MTFKTLNLRMNLFFLTQDCTFFKTSIIAYLPSRSLVMIDMASESILIAMLMFEVVITNQQTSTDFLDLTTTCEKSRIVYFEGRCQFTTLLFNVFVVVQQQHCNCKVVLLQRRTYLEHIYSGKKLHIIRKKWGAKYSSTIISTEKFFEEERKKI